MINVLVGARKFQGVKNGLTMPLQFDSLSLTMFETIATNQLSSFQSRHGRLACWLAFQLANVAGLKV